MKSEQGAARAEPDAGAIAAAAAPEGAITMQETGNAQGTTSLQLGLAWGFVGIPLLFKLFQ